jgi:hypothetical protein
MALIWLTKHANYRVLTIDGLNFFLEFFSGLGKWSGKFHLN